MVPARDLKKFTAEYAGEVQELLVLTAEGVRGAAKWGSSWCPSASLLAYIDTADGSLHGSVKEPKGVLQWLIGDDEKGNWGFGLRPVTIYRVKVRKRKGRLTNDYFMLTEVWERLATEPQLEPIRQAYLQPKTLTDAGLPGVEFELEREFDWFTAQVDWLDADCEIHLECDDDDNENAAAALANFKKIYAAVEDWDAKMRALAAAGLTENANDWQEDCGDGDEPYQPLSEEDFARRISISSFHMYPDGSFSAYYNDDDMFFGHVIMVDGNLDGEFREPYLAG